MEVYIYMYIPTLKLSCRGIQEPPLVLSDMCVVKCVRVVKKVWCVHSS